jgi:hypothetical protein
MFESLKAFLKANPNVVSALIGSLGVLGGAFFAFLIQIYLSSVNRKAEWNRKRKEVYAKWIGIYFEYLGALPEQVRLNMEIRKTDAHRVMPSQLDPNGIEKRYLDLHTRFDSLTSRLHELQAKLHEYETMILIYESNFKTIERFRAATKDHTNPGLDGQALVTFLEEYKLQQIQNINDFARTLCDKQP